LWLPSGDLSAGVEFGLARAPTGRPGVAIWMVCQCVGVVTRTGMIEVEAGGRVAVGIEENIGWHIVAIAQGDIGRGDVGRGDVGRGGVAGQQVARAPYLAIMKTCPWKTCM